MTSLEDLIGQWASRANVTDWQRQAKKHKHRCVYILESRGVYKIGRTENLPKRIKSLQVGNPFGLQIAHVIFTEEYIKVEQALHTIFAHDRANNEWFSLGMRDLAVLRSISVPLIFQWADSLKKHEPEAQADDPRDQMAFDW